jgi:hypothetical protein
MQNLIQKVNVFICLTFQGSLNAHSFKYLEMRGDIIFTAVPTQSEFDSQISVLEVKHKLDILGSNLVYIKRKDVFRTFN